MARELRLHRLEAVVDAPAEVAHQDGDEEAAAPATSSSRRGLMRAMSTMVPTKVATVLAVYMIPGPSTMRTADRSLVARLMRSPMRCALVVARGEPGEVGEEVVAQLELDLAADADEHHAHEVAEDALQRPRARRSAPA